MGVGDFFSKINTAMEEKYSALLDFLQNKGLPAYKYNDWLETHGIPAMWFSIGSIVFIILLIVLLAFMIFPSSINVTANFTNSDFQPITDQVYLTISSENKQLFSGTVKSGDKFSIKGASIGDTLSVTAQLEGYSLSGSGIFVVNSKQLPLSIQFKRSVSLGTSKITLVDKESSTPVSKAEVSLYDVSGTLIATGYTDDFGDVEFPNVPINEETVLKIKRDGYADYESTIVLAEDMGEIQLQRSEITDGSVSTVKFKVSSLNEPIADVRITLYEAASGKLIGEEQTDDEGVALLSVGKGTTIRYIAHKEGFVNFDSNSKGLNKTIVASQEEIMINLMTGGSDLSVIVKDTTGIPIKDVFVGIYGPEGQLIDANRTDTLGTIKFSGIDVRRTAYVSAFYDGYYHYSQAINVEQTQELEITLEEIKLSEAAVLELFVRDSSNKPVGNATINVFVKENSRYVPLAFENSVTEGSGFFTGKFRPGQTLKIDAYSGNLEGSIEIDLNKGRNQLEMFLEPAGGLVRINVFDAFNNPMTNVDLTAKTKTGEVLFAGVVNESGYIEGFTQGNSEMIVEVLDLEGNLYSKIVQVKKIIDVRFSKSDAIENPVISFLGVYNGAEELVNNLQPGKTYWLKFKAAWPSAVGEGGIHIRVGENGVPAKEQDYGILMADAPNVTSYKYGLTYNPTTVEGTPKDYQVLGRPGLINKWVELGYDLPAGVTEVKVKLKVLENTDANNVNVYYRAWKVKDGDYLRDPQDPFLLKMESTSTRNSLYAETYVEEINVSSETMNCAETFCVSYTLRDDLTSYDPFYPIVDSVYALDLEFIALNNTVINLALTTNKDTKKVYFNNYEFDPVEFKPMDEVHYDFDLKGLSLTQGERKKARIYFTTAATGNSFVKFAITGSSSFEKQIDFQITDKKDFTISLTNNGLINIGEDIYAVLRDSQGYLQNAYIYVIDERGATAFFTKGDATENNGANGNYFVGSLPSGEYRMVAKSPGYITRDLGFIVTRIGVLDIAPEIEVRIPKGTKNIRYDLDIINKSNYDVKKMEFKVLREDTENFKYDMRFLKSYITKRGKGSLIIELSSEIEDVAYGDLDLVVSGVLDTKEVVRTITHIKFSNSTDYDSACLVVAPAELKLNMPDYQNASQEVEFLVENQCMFKLVFDPEFVSRDGEDKQINFSMRSFSLDKGEKKTVKAKFSNMAQRDSEGLIADFFLNLKTLYFNKQIPTTIDVWKTATALTMVAPPYVFTYGESYSFIPLVVTNSGNLPIKNIRFMQVNDARLLLNTIPDMADYVNQYYDPLNSMGQTNNAYDSRYMNYLNYNPIQNVDPNYQNYMQGLNQLSEPIGNYLEIRYPYLVGENLPLASNNVVLNPQNTGGVQYDQYGNPIQYDAYGNPLTYSQAYYGNQQNSNVDPYYANNIALSSGGINQYLGVTPYYQRMNHNFVFRPNTIAELKPGETQYVNVLVMQTSQKSSGVTQYGLVGKGSIDGARKTLQGNAMVTIYSSGYNCFKILNVDQTTATTYTFTSEKIGTEFNPKRIRVVNECTEPVQVMGLTSQNVGGNPIRITSGSGIILPGARGEIYIGGKAERESECIPTNVSLVAGTMQSQKPMLLPILLSVCVGKSATNVQSNQDPLQKWQGIICDSTSESKTVYFPKIATTGDCSSGYCDGENLSKFLLNKVKAYKESYSAKVAKFGARRSNIPCDTTQAYCHFEDLGINNHTFTVYLMNDVVSDKYVDKKLSEMDMGLKIANFYTSDIDVRQVSGAKILYLPASMNKCGKYELEIEGSALILAGVFQTDTYSVKVKVNKYDETDECKVNVLNAGIFLPQDKEIKEDNFYDFLPGFINYKDADLKAIAEKASTKILGTQRLGQRNGNLLMIEKGETSVGSNVDVTISGGDPSSIIVTATVNKNLPVTNASTQTDIVDAIAGYFTGTFKGCVSEDLTTARVVSKDKPQEGAFKIEGCESIKIYKGKPTCKFTISTSSIMNSVKVIADDGDGSGGYTAQILDNGKPIDETVELKPARSQGVMKKELDLVLDVTNVQSALKFSQDDKLMIILRGSDDSEYTSKAISFAGCGINPESFVLNVLKERDSTQQTQYWAVTKWTEAGDKKLICDVFAKHKDFKDEGKPFVLASEDCTNLYSTQKATDKVTTNMGLGIGAGVIGSMTGCLAAEGITSIKGLLGPWGWGSALFSCGLATADLAGTSGYQIHMQRVKAGLDNGNTMIDRFHNWAESTTLLGWYTNDYSKIDPAVAMNEHHTLMMPFENWFGSGRKEITGVATNDAQDLAVEGMAVGAIRQGPSALALRTANNATEAYLEALAKHAAASGTTGEAFATLAENAPTNIKTLEATAREMAKKAGVSFEQLVSTTAFQKSMAEITSSAGAGLTAGMTAATQTELAAISGELGKVSTEMKLWQRIANSNIKSATLSGSNLIIKTPWYRGNLTMALTPAATADLTTITNAAGNRILTGNTITDLTFFKNSVLQGGQVGTGSHGLLNLQFQQRLEAINNMIVGKPNIPVEIKPIDLARPQNTKQILDQADDLAKNIKSVRTIPSSVGKAGAAGAKTKTTFARGAWRFVRGMARGLVSYEAAGLGYKAAFNLFMDQVRYNDKILYVKLDKVEQFVLYETYSMRYDNVGESKQILIVSDGMNGKNLSGDCSVDETASTTSTDLSGNQTFSGKDEELLTKLREINSTSYENAKEHMKEFNAAYSKVSSSSEKALLLALADRESSVRMTDGGIMQLDEEKCNVAKSKTNYSTEDCLNDIQKNIESGIAYYNINYGKIQSALSAKSISDSKAREFFALAAYDIGEDATSAAIGLWKGGTEIEEALSQGCKTEHSDTRCAGYDFPIEIYGNYLYMVGKVDSQEAGQKSIIEHLGKLVNTNESTSNTN